MLIVTVRVSRHALTLNVIIIVIKRDSVLYLTLNLTLSGRKVIQGKLSNIQFTRGNCDSKMTKYRGQIQSNAKVYLRESHVSIYNSR